MFSVAALAVTLAAVVVLSRRGVPLAVGLMGSSLALGLITGVEPATIGAAFLRTVVRPDVVSLALVVLGLSCLGKVMSQSGAFDNLLLDARSLVQNQLVLLSGFPALLGMLTIPGGAIMSASMVGEIGDGLGMNGHQKAACNNLFRHLWYFAYMIHPMYALIESVSGVRLLTLFKLGVGPAALAWVVALRTCARRGEPVPGPRGHRGQAARRLAYSALPILVVAVGRGVLGMNFVGAVVLGLATAILYGWSGPWYWSRFRAHVGLRLRFKPDLWLSATAVGVMVFQEFIRLTEVNRGVAALITEQGIPLQLTALLIPLALGLVSGSNLAAVGMSIPLFVSVAPPGMLDRYVVFAYTSSVAGYMMSPVHLCHVLSCQYFGVTQERVVRHMLPTLLTLVAGSALLLLA